MKYDIKLRFEKEFEEDPKNYKGSRIGCGWVEIESAIKFPVNIMRTNDNQHMFVKYPFVKNGDGYFEVISPLDRETREELDKKILAEFHELNRRGFYNPEISEVKVKILQEDIQYGKISVKGYASIRIEDFIIRNIAIKESYGELFVQMPQYRDENGTYHDLVYGSNDFMQLQIKKEVLHAYEREKNIQQKEVSYAKNKINKETVPKM